MTSERGLQIVVTILVFLALVIPASATLAITGIEPSSGLNTEDDLYISNLSGTDFPGQGEATVALRMSGEENITGRYVTVVSPSRITCVFDLTGRKAGLWDVVVINETSGESVTREKAFAIENPSPEITAISPAFGENDDWVDITNLAGSNFLPNVTVNLTRGATIIPGENVTRVSSSQITCRFNITFAEPGFYNVTVTNEDGKYKTLINGFEVRYPRPVVTAIYPSSGTNDMVVGITNLSGSGFMPGANVSLRRSGHDDIPTINGAIVESSGKILCFFDLNGAHVGKWDVVVRNLDGQNGTLPSGFTIYYPDAPSVTGIVPATGQNTGNILANVTGSGFHENPAVLLSKGTQAVAGSVLSVSGTDIGVRFNLTGVPAGKYNLTVTNEDGQGATKVEAFTVTNPPPTVTDVDPSSALNTGDYVLLDITGTGFLSGATVTFTRGSTTFSESSTYVNSTHLRCTVSFSGKEAGEYNVTVTNTDGLSGTWEGVFTIQNPAPVVHAISPPGGQNTGLLENVVVTGENFLPGAGVNLTRSGENPITGSPVTWINATALSCTFDLTGKKAGAWTVVVANPDGRTSIEPVVFTITNPPPNPQDIVPDSWPNNGPVGITGLTGSGFLPNATVKLTREGENDIPGTGVDINVTSQTIMCFFNLNGARVGYWNVVVRNDDGQSGTLENAFFVRYPAAPAVLAIEPASGPNDGPITISNLSGSGFHPNATVRLTRASLPDIIATNVTVVDSGKITCTLNLAGAVPGSWDVIVTNDDGQAGEISGGFEVRYPAPTVTGITPARGNNNQIVPFTLTGSNFRSGVTVKLARASHTDIVATGVSLINSSALSGSFNLNGMDVGDWDLVVMNNDGQSATHVNGFTIEYPNPVVSSILPTKGANDGPLQITAVKGNYFREGATVTLTRTGLAPIEATDVHVINATTLNCTVNLQGRTIGLWNVVVTNDDGKSGQLANGFQILPPPPVPDFSASPVYGTVPLTVQFTDLTTNNPTAWIWDFGDGSQSGVLDRNPVHTYNAVGTYNVTLTVFNTGAPEGRSITKTSYITVVRTPVADFTATPTSGNAPLLVQFTDTSMGNPTGWVWTFGDGSMSTQQNPYHLYTSPGVYSVTLSVRNSAGSNAITKEGLITVRALPVADFSANRTSGPAPLVVKFTDGSSGGPTSWTWNFGDGTSSTEQNPVHQYNVPGVYTVSLTAANDVGTAEKTKTGYITVGERLTAAFTYTTSNPENLAPLTVAFMDGSGDSPTMWAWNFGDGHLTTEKNPIHTYTKAGNYTVTLTVSDGFASSSTSKTIEVKPRLIADFKVEPSTGSAPLKVKLIDQTIGTPNSWRWVIVRDALNMTVFDPGQATETYTFNEPGSYDVILTVSDAYGNTDTVMKTSVVQVLPFP